MRISVEGATHIDGAAMHTTWKDHDVDLQEFLMHVSLEIAQELARMTLHVLDAEEEMHQGPVH